MHETFKVDTLSYDNVSHHLVGWYDGEELFICEEWNIDIEDLHGDVTLNEDYTKIWLDEPREVTVNQENYELVEI